MGNRGLLTWFLAGFAAAVVFSAAGAAAFAQSLPSTTTRPGTPAQTAVDQGTDATNPVLDGVLGDDGALADGKPQLDQYGRPLPRTDGQRPVLVDGDLNAIQEPQQPLDGVVDTGEPLPVKDGVDALNVDTRSAADIAAFENPPAGYNPLLFQVEDIDPVRDNRRTRRLAELDPYDPIGIRVGSFVLFPEVEFATAYTSNVLLSPNADSDVFGVMRPRMRLVSNWNTHAVEFNASGDLSEHAEYESENDRGYTIEARGRLDVTRRTNLQGIVSRSRTQESRSSPDANVLGGRADVTTDRAEGVINHRFNRLSLQLRGSVSDFQFSDTDDGLGGTVINSDRNYTEYAETGRATWEFKPTFSVFGEVEINQRHYDRVALSDGFDRSSNGERYRVGVAFGNDSEILRGEIAIGYGIQRPDSPALRAIDGLIIDANATWRVNGLTSVLFNASSDVSETSTANVGGAMSRSAGVELRHAFRRHLIGSAGMSYRTQDSQDGVIDDKEWVASLGLEYFLNREVVLFGRYEHTDFDGVGTTSDYTGDEIRVGVRLRR